MKIRIIPVSVALAFSTFAANAVVNGTNNGFSSPIAQVGTWTVFSGSFTLPSPDQAYNAVNVSFMATGTGVGNPPNYIHGFDVAFNDGTTGFPLSGVLLKYTTTLSGSSYVLDIAPSYTTFTKNFVNTYVYFSGLELIAPIGGATARGVLTAYYSATAPVPEPETLALMVAGVGVVGIAVRRARRT